MPSRRVVLAPLILAAALHECLADPAVSLKTSPRLDTDTPPGAADPYYLDADTLQGHKDRELVAEGRVFLRRRNQQVHADWLRYDQTTDELEARGQVRLVQERDEVAGNYLKLKITPRLGHMDEVRYTFHDEKGRMGRGEAAVVRFEGPDRYRMEQATYTTCPAGSEDWVLKAEDLKLDYVEKLGAARQVQVRYLDTPILYTPWMDFSLDDRRKSGFLTPSYGASDKRGLELLTPWYWNIAPNRDATFFPRLMTRRGLQMGVEYRYLDKAYNGEAALEVLPNDRVADRNRVRGVLRHAQVFDDRWSGNLFFERVSDDAYFTDLSSLVRETSRVNLLQEGTLTYNAGWWRAMGRIQTFQTLQDPLAPVTPPYQRVPQITVSGSRERPGTLPVRWDLAGELVRFSDETDTRAEGNRIDLYPSLSLPLSNAWGFLTPKLGLRHTRYDLDRNPAGSTNPSRSLPIASIDTGVFMERDASYFDHSFVQTLEPRLYYVYIPYRDQSGLPNFDTGLSDLSLDQLFSENQYSGVDRVNDANQITLAVTSRLIEPNGIERLQATVGQRFYFSDQRVLGRGGDSSDLLLQLSGQVTDRLRLTGGLQFDTDAGETVKANLGGTYRDGPGRVFNADYRYTNDRYAAGLDQLDVSWQWPLKPKWYGLGRINYSFQESRLVEGLLGLEYNAGCWSLRGVVHRLATSEAQVTDAFFLQLELHGLTALGPNPLEVLKRSISGYTKSDEINLP